MQYDLDALLARVEKPARYTGSEMNAEVKSLKDADVSFAFCFPDTYEVAMSHLGMKILYGILNDLPYAVCELVCMPWVDMLEEMPAKIVEAQSADVDGMTGATVTTDAVKAAVNDALAQAGLKDAA